MRDPNRIINILSRLKKVWEKYPDMRLTQLILNVESNDTPFLYYKEDEDFINSIEEYYAQLEKKD